MTIQTKFDVGEKIFAKQNGRLFSGCITKIEVQISDTHRLVYCHIYRERFSEEECFRTKEEAVASIEIVTVENPDASPF
jgi:hypothetical protein